MKTWEALSTLCCAKAEADRRPVPPPEEREAIARAALRQIGITEKEIEEEFPFDILAAGLKLIVENPEEFARQCQLSARRLHGLN